MIYRIFIESLTIFIGISYLIFIDLRNYRIYFRIFIESFIELLSNFFINLPLFYYYPITRLTVPPPRNSACTDIRVSVHAPLSGSLFSSFLNAQILKYPLNGACTVKRGNRVIDVWLGADKVQRYPKLHQFLFSKP